MTSPRKPRAAIEFLKLMRSGVYSRPEIQAEMGWAEMTAYHWVDEWLDNGLLVEVPNIPSGEGHRTPRLFTLSPAWGGTYQQENAR